MDNFDLKKYLVEGKLFKENSPGYDTRKQGETIGSDIREVIKKLSPSEKKDLVKLSNNVINKAKKSGFNLYVNLKTYSYGGAEIELCVKHNHRNPEGSPEYNFMNDFKYKVERGVKVSPMLGFDVTTGSFSDSWDESTISIDKYLELIK